MAALFEDHQRPVAGGEIDTVRALLHDLRQPLAAILLLAGTEGGDVGRKMDGIAGQARWLAELVETSLSEAAADEVTTTDVGAVAQPGGGPGPGDRNCVISIDRGRGPRGLGPAGGVEPGPGLRARQRRACRRRRRSRAGRAPTPTVTGSTSRSPTTDRGSARSAPRTSLGLTTTRAMVAACHGSFRLHAGEDGGTVADICLAQAELRRVAS